MRTVLSNIVLVMLFVIIIFHIFLFIVQSNTQVFRLSKTFFNLQKFIYKHKYLIFSLNTIQNLNILLQPIIEYKIP